MTKINSVVIKTGTTNDFFTNTKKIMKTLDRGELINSTNVITFEDPKDLIQFLSPRRIEIINAIKNHPGSITNIAKSLDRNRTAVSKDIKEMLKFGLVTVNHIVNPGHGHYKLVKLVYPEVTLQASF